MIITTLARIGLQGRGRDGHIVLNVKIAARGITMNCSQLSHALERSGDANT